MIIVIFPDYSIFLGQTTKQEDWLTAIQHQINEFVYDCYARLLILPTHERLHTLIFIVDCFERTTLRKLDSVATIYYSIARLKFENFLSDSKENPRLIYDCQPYLERALYWAHQPDTFQSKDIEELRNSIWMHQCIHESSNARRTGVRLLEDHLKNDEELNMDMVWSIVDKFREAMLLAKERDIEGMVSSTIRF